MWRSFSVAFDMHLRQKFIYQNIYIEAILRIFQTYRDIIDTILGVINKT